jgi:hypothetical protein
MPSTREPIHLLEPSNLLEPLNLTEGSASESVSPDDGPSRVVTPTTPPKPTPPKPTATPIRHRGRRLLTSGLIVAGALGCFAAGTALPQLTSVAVRDISPATPPERGAQMAIQTDPPKPLAPSDESKPVAAPVAATPNEPGEAKQDASKRNAPDGQAASAVKEAAAGAAKPCNQQGASKDDCLDEAAALRRWLDPSQAAQPIRQAKTSKSSKKAGTELGPVFS